MTIGTVYKVQPQPPEEANTRWIDAGPLRFGVEWRDVDPASLAATYAGDAESMAEIEDRSPEGGFFDTGVSLHVVDAASGHEYLRFDCFDEEPHYHYVAPSGDANRVVPYDAVAGGDMLPWAIERLRTRLPEMLVAAGGGALAERVDTAALAPALAEVAELARGIRSGVRG